MEIRAQAMINHLTAQLKQAIDQGIYFSAEIAVRDAKIIELRNQIEAFKNCAEPAAA